MKLKKFMALATAIVMSLSMVACGNQNKTEGNNSDKIVIGTMGPLTGSNAIYGISTSNGIKLAIEQKQTVLNKPVELLSVDDKADQTEAVNAYNKFVNNDGVVGVVGATTSGAALSVAITSAKYGTPILTPTGTVPEITTSGDNVFRACYTDPFQGEIMAKFAFENLGLKKIAIMENIDSSYSEGVKNSFVTKFEELGGEIVASEGYKESDNDFKAQLTKIASSTPEALFIPDYYTKAYLISSQAKDSGLKDIVLLGSDGWDGMNTIAEDTSVVENSYFSSHFSLDDKDPKVQEFINAYKTKYGEVPNGFAALGYDGANIMLNAIEKSGSTDSKAIVEAISNTQYEGVTGNIKFDENGDPIKSVSIIQIKDGQYKLLDKLEK